MGKVFNTMVKGNPLDFESIFVIVPFFFQRKKKKKSDSPNLARDHEVYHLHIEEGLRVGQLAERYSLSKARILSICWSIKKQRKVKMSQNRIKHGSITIWAYEYLPENA